MPLVWASSRLTLSLCGKRHRKGVRYSDRLYLVAQGRFTLKSFFNHFLVCFFFWSVVVWVKLFLNETDAFLSWVVLWHLYVAGCSLETWSLRFGSRYMEWTVMNHKMIVCSLHKWDSLPGLCPTVFLTRYHLEMQLISSRGRICGQWCEWSLRQCLPKSRCDYPAPAFSSDVVSSTCRVLCL